MRRLLAVLLALVMLTVCATVMDRDRPGDPSWEDMDPAQLSWVIEGIQEHISDLQDDLARAKFLQADKLAVARPPPE